MDRTLIKIDRKVFYLFLGLILVCGVYVIATNLYTDQNLFGHQIYNATIGWTNLTGYPVACPSGSAITQLDDSVTCTAYNDVTTFNATGATIDTLYSDSINTTLTYVDFLCLEPTCQHNITYNGTHTVIT